MATTYDLLLRGGVLVDHERVQRADVGVVDGKIAAIGDLSSATARETLDATGLHILPGVIDTQVHFREPGLEHKEDLESGTRAAIMGGTTTVFEMPNTNPTTTTQAALEDKLARAKGRTWCDYAFFVGGTTENAAELAALEMMPGTPGVKIFMGSSTGTLLVPDDDHLRAVLRSGVRPCPIHSEDEFRLRERKALISENPHVREHPFLRDPESSILATRRILGLSEETSRPVHILHISTRDEPWIIADARKRGVRATAEVTPQHLYFTAPECYERLGTKVQMNTPIRDAAHRDGLRRALLEGFFDVIGSDHAPHTLEEKAQPYPASPSGMPGVQTLLTVMMNFVHEGLLDLPTLVRMTSFRPAELYGIARKGVLAVGFDADFALVDLGKRHKIESDWLQSKCGWSPYEGDTFVGSVEHVVLRGQIQVRDRALASTASAPLPQPLSSAPAREELASQSGAGEGSRTVAGRMPAVQQIGRPVEFSWKP
ncbi:MAG: dihydroorotase [Fimbriimonadaceae bacterium]|nr:dihydroorotase [Fimbriimonadaceae bacterium]